MLYHLKYIYKDVLNVNYSILSDEIKILNYLKIKIIILRSFYLLCGKMEVGNNCYSNMYDGLRGETSIDSRFESQLLKVSIG